MIKPYSLKKGDVIGLVSPSAPLAGLYSHRLKKGIEFLTSLGFKVRIGKNALKVTDYTAGTPRERAEDINEFFGDKNIKGIFSFIGGNHSNQILEYLDFSLIEKNPKVFMGYSDITILDIALYKKSNLVTFYGPMVLTQFAEFPRTFSYTEEYFLKAVMCPSRLGVVKPSIFWTDEILDWSKKEDLLRARRVKRNKGWSWLREGKGEGRIIGGCINSLMHLRGTEYWPDFNGAIFFWEIPESECDFRKGEKVESIDAYLTDLDLSGVFRAINGMIVGRPYRYNEKEINNLVNVIKKRTEKYSFPILFNVDIGHTDPMITIPLGVRVRIDSKENIFEFLESGTL